MALEDEPKPDAESLVEFGGEVWYAVGFTEGGAPFGPSLEELREDMARIERGRGWARAKRAMFMAVRGLGHREPEVGWVRKLGEGLSRAAFAAEVDVGFEGWPKSLVALVPAASPIEAGTRPLEKVEREARLLRFLAGWKIGFRVPGMAVAIGDDDGPVLVCECLEGIQIDLRAGRMGSVVPWKVVGRVAAEVHGIDGSEVGWLPGYATRREHGEALLASLADLEGSSRAEVAASLEWLRGHLPPDEPSNLLHGDLLGKNLLLLMPDLDTAVVDWKEAQRGDPAYDLAIVTRGNRRPFQIDRGLEKLIEAYTAAGGRALGEEDVRFHEIALHLKWLFQADRGEAESGEPPESVLQRLRNLLRAVGAANTPGLR